MRHSRTEIISVSTFKMDQLKSLGLSIDDEENLRLLEPSVDKESRELAQKARLFVQQLDALQERLARTEALLEQLVDQTNKAKLVGIATRIAEINDMKHQK